MKQLRRFAPAIAFASLLLAGTVAQAQGHIDQPHGHDHYSVELQPHLVVEWNDYWGFNDGIGVGMHASIPVMQDGPVETINNSLAITIGLDWAHFGGCYWYNNRGVIVNGTGDCSANDFLLPIALQWNFFFSKLISAFPELGLGIRHVSWDSQVVCGPGGRCTGSNTGVDLVLWLGVRFHLAKSFALTLKLGTPSLLLGVSFFL